MERLRASRPALGHHHPEGGPCCATQVGRQTDHLVQARSCPSPRPSACSWLQNGISQGLDEFIPGGGAHSRRSIKVASSQLGASNASGFWCSETLRPHGRPRSSSQLDEPPKWRLSSGDPLVFVPLENS